MTQETIKQKQDRELNNELFRSSKGIGMLLSGVGIGVLETLAILLLDDSVSMVSIILTGFIFLSVGFYMVHRYEWDLY